MTDIQDLARTMSFKQPTRVIRLIDTTEHITHSTNTVGFEIVMKLDKKTELLMIITQLE